jgi:hypothetical protein
MKIVVKFLCVQKSIQVFLLYLPRKKMSTTKTRRKTSSKKKPLAEKSAGRKKTPRKWSKKVNETSNALDLEQDVFKGKNPKKIAQSLKR